MTQLRDPGFDEAVDRPGHPPPIEESVQEIYRRRFAVSTRARRNAVWKVLCARWFSRFVRPSDRVLEIGAGYCEFINHIVARERIAVDLNRDTRAFAAAGVQVIEADACDISSVVASASCDVVFMSNFLEHCRSRDHLLLVLRNVREVLAPRGRVMILGPNFRYSFRSYYDYFDHHLALTDRSVVEALELVGLHARTVKARTLPFSFRSRFSSHPWLVAIYVALPMLWPLFGAQFFIVATAD